jgi:hypothetical protein
MSKTKEQPRHPSFQSHPPPLYRWMDKKHITEATGCRQSASNTMMMCFLSRRISSGGFSHISVDNLRQEGFQITKENEF